VVPIFDSKPDLIPSLGCVTTPLTSLHVQSVVDHQAFSRIKRFDFPPDISSHHTTPTHFITFNLSTIFNLISLHFNNYPHNQLTTSLKMGFMDKFIMKVKSLGKKKEMMADSKMEAPMAAPMMDEPMAAPMMNEPMAAPMMDEPMAAPMAAPMSTFCPFPSTHSPNIY
jgi:hypothetical protein